MISSWNKLPLEMQTNEVKLYYDLLLKKRGYLFIKRLFDIIMALFLLIIMAPLFLIIAILITLDSPGGIFFRQIRITAMKRPFKIFKFRTMVKDAERKGSLVTVGNDCRITKIGHFLRKTRLDEIPQLLNILTGDMTFVGTRPEVEKYVNSYTPEMYATLLLPAGVTSEASICYKNEDALLNNAESVDFIYIERILPEKMAWNLAAIKKAGLFYDLKIMIKTITAVL